MEFKLLLIVAVALCTALSGCKGSVVENGPKKEVSAYSEKIIEADIPLQLVLDCENSSIEVYSWNRNEVKFEMTKRIKGRESKDNLFKLLNGFNIFTNKESGRINLICRYKGNSGKFAECLLGLKVFIPKKTNRIDCTQKTGKLKFIDDLHCNLNINTDSVVVEINRLEGRLVYKTKSGDLRISAGVIETDSFAQAIDGNIRIKGQFREAGSYSFKTGTGIVGLCLPDDLNAAFENLGQVETCNFIKGDYPAKFKLESKIGKIEISKF